MASRPRRHSVVTLTLTVTPDEVFFEDDKNSSSFSPRTRPFQQRGSSSRGPPYLPHHYQHSPRGERGVPPSSPLRRTPTSPLPQRSSTPSSASAAAGGTPLYRTPSSPLNHKGTNPSSSPNYRTTPTSPLPAPPLSPIGRKNACSPSPVSPRSGGQFRYDSSAVTCQSGSRQSGGTSGGGPVGGGGPLARRSSLLTVPAMGHDLPPEPYFRPSRPRSSSLAGPAPTPDVLR